MTDVQRSQVVELLELAHGYALLGSCMPFRTACIELDVRGSEASVAAGEAIDRARKEMGLPDKPAAEKYREAIGVALERVENGTWP